MLQTVWSGLVLGAVYALVASGLTISGLCSGTFNFAHGAIVVAGTYLAYTVLAVHRLGLIPLVLISAALGIVLGLICETVCIRPLRRLSRAGAQRNEMITTVGFSTALIGAIGLKWGYLARAVPFEGSPEPVRAFGVIARPDQLVVVVTSIVAAAGLHVWTHRSHWGLACLAVAEDREAASLRGIDVDGLSMAGFAAAGVFGTLSAIAIGPITYAVPTLAVALTLGGFVAIALGGTGNFLGILAAAFVVGSVSSLTTRYLDANLANLTVLALLVATLIARPVGLTGQRTARDV